MPHDEKTKARFFKKVAARNADECWPWRAYVGATGYGRFHTRGTTKNAHRISWEIDQGRFAPAGLVVRHKCDNRLCVNPSHLVIGTYQQNTQDAMERGRLRLPPRPKRLTHCKRGHEFTPESTIPARPRRGRQCKICRKEADALRPNRK